jgi:thiosulfate/3-mercaptopyruvate sulfurtransferase
MSSYAHPETLVETDWLAEHLDDPSVRVVEVDVDTKAYEEGHIPGAVGWNWQQDLCDTVRRDIVPRESLESLLRRSGIDHHTTVVLYGDNNNWFACWAYWQLAMFGLGSLQILNGGRKKWIAEERELTQEVPMPEPTEIALSEPDQSSRAFLADVMAQHADEAWTLVDVRSPDEFTGVVLAPPGLPETCQRGGHIPRASNIPWGKNCAEDGTFKTREELQALYDAAGVTRDRSVITYCRIGERSSLSWFVLDRLLGYDRVVNYDGSWTEWGNLVNAPVER